jgi:hypothetical protein
MALGDIFSPFNTTATLILTTAQNSLALLGQGNVVMFQNPGNAAINVWTSNTTAFAVNSASANTNNAFTGVMVSAGGRLLFPVPMTIGVTGTTYIVAQSVNSGGTLQATLGLGGIMI